MLRAYTEKFPGRYRSSASLADGGLDAQGTAYERYTGEEKEQPENR